MTFASRGTRPGAGRGRRRGFVFCDAAGDPDRAAHLLDVPDAALAEVEVLLDERGLRGGKRALEVAGDELDQLLAADVVGRLSHRNAARAPPARDSARGAGARARRPPKARAPRTLRDARTPRCRAAR